MLAMLAIYLGMTINGIAPWRSNQSFSLAPDAHACRYSDQIYTNDEALMRQRAPTQFRLMTSRYVEIVQSARGHECSGQAGVAFNGHHYFQAGMSDDPGIAELAPAISSLTGLSLASAFDLVAFALIFGGIATGYAGFCRLYAEPEIRWVGAVVFLCLGLAEAIVADVYIFQVSPLFAGIPWILYFAFNRKDIALSLSAALLAFSCSWCSLIRIGTTPICIAFLATLFIVRYRLREMFVPLLLIILACLPAMHFERSLNARRDRFLISVGQPATAVNNHPVWHAIYVGLGFIPNYEVPKFSDSVAMEKVRSIDPTAPYTSARYEDILRREVIRISVHEPLIPAVNLAAKAGILAILAFVILFPARRLLFVGKQVRWLDASFVAAIVMSAGNIILVAPKPPYLLTFLYSCVKVCGELSSRPKHTRTAEGSKCGLAIPK
jgi:hypothetical protein